MRDFYVYIMSNRSKTLYVGVTNNLERRVFEHKDGASTFTGRYRLAKLVYFELFPSVTDAIAREKQIKGWLRAKKVELIESFNPEWDDISVGWYSNSGDSSLRSE